MMQHMGWHGDPMANSMGFPRRSISMGQPGSGHEFLQFHHDFLSQFFTWFNAQPADFRSQFDVSAWHAIPQALKNTILWNSTWANAEDRLTNHLSSFSTDDELGLFIESQILVPSSGIHNQFLHGAAAIAFNDGDIGSPTTSPGSSYFYQLHGLIDFWWSNWRTLHKPVIVDIVTKNKFKEFQLDKVIEKNKFKELIKDHPEKLHTKEIKEWKEAAFEVPDPFRNIGDPEILTQLSERLTAMEKQITKIATFIQPSQRPVVGEDMMKDAKK